jgi:hypothetical protein
VNAKRWWSFVNRIGLEMPRQQTVRLADGEGKQRILKASSGEFRKDLTEKELELRGLRNSGWRSEPNPGR